MIFFGLVSSFKLPHNGKGLCEVRATATESGEEDETLAKTIFVFPNLQKIKNEMFFCGYFLEFL